MPQIYIYTSKTHVFSEPTRSRQFFWLFSVSWSQWKQHYPVPTPTLISGKAMGGLNACAEMSQNLTKTTHRDLLLHLLFLI